MSKSPLWSFLPTLTGWVFPTVSFSFIHQILLNLCSKSFQFIHLISSAIPLVKAWCPTNPYDHSSMCVGWSSWFRSHQCPPGGCPTTTLHVQPEGFFMPHLFLLHHNCPWRRKWQPTPVFLPGESHGQRSLVGYSPWGCRVRYNSATKHICIIARGSPQGQ